MSDEEQSSQPSKVAKTAEASATIEIPAKNAVSAKSAKAPAPPDPRVVAATAKAVTLKEQMEHALGYDAVEEVGAMKDIPILRIKPDRWRDAVAFLGKTPDLDYSYMELFSGTDYPDYLEVIVHLRSFQHQTSLYVKTRTNREDAHLPSITPIIAGANWEEREAFDLLGIRFDGHPDMRRIMMWEGWHGHPLRKDYSAFENEPEQGGDLK